MIENKDFKLLLKHHIDKDINRNNLTSGQKFADKMTNVLGSYPYLIAINGTIVLWILMQFVIPFDRQLLILNFILSYQAAIGTPMLQMSSNRQSSVDRRHMETDLQINIETKKILEEVSNKIDKQDKVIDELKLEIQKSRGNGNE